MRRIIAALLCLAGCSPAPRTASDAPRWAVYYDDKLPAEAFEEMEVVVFDRRHHPDLAPLQGKTQVLAYVSIGEVYHDVPERKQLEKADAILFQNDTWKSYAVDTTSPLWKKLVLKYVEDAAKQGFDGVMLDTIDSPLHWTRTKAPTRQEEMQKAAVALIQAIRERHPHFKIMLNRGFELLPEVGHSIDFILAESILIDGDVSTGHFDYFPANSYTQAAEQLHHVVALAPHLQVFTLDYWDQDDVKGLERIYDAQRAQGFVPYVTTRDLRTFTPEPLATSHAS